MSNGIADSIRDAATHIERHGMTKGCLKETDGRVCMLGALGAVFYHGQAEASVFLDDWMRENLGPTPDRLGALRPTAYWNDRPETTQEDVLLWMKKAAHDADGV